MLLVSVYFISYFIKGAIGTGNLAMMVLLGALILEPHHAVALALGVTCFAQLQFFSEGMRYTDWSIMRPVILSTYVGVALGIWIFGNLDGTWLSIVLGGSLGVLIISDITKLMARFAGKVDFRRHTVLFPATMVFGFISGVSGAGTLTSVAFYIKQITSDVRTLRGTILMLGIIFAFWRLTLLWVAGFFTASVALEAALLLPPMVLFGHLGNKCFHIMSDKRYYQVFQLILLCLAMTLVVKGLIKVL